jgi:hypothetical protein
MGPLPGYYNGGPIILWALFYIIQIIQEDIVVVGGRSNYLPQPFPPPLPPRACTGR